MKRAMLFTVVGLLFAAVMSAAPSAYAQERTDLGTIAIPRDMSFQGEDQTGPITITMPKGDYGLLLTRTEDGRYLLILLSDAGAYSLDTQYAESSAAVGEPKASVNVVKKDGEDRVEIKAQAGRIEAVALVKCAKQQ